MLISDHEPLNDLQLTIMKHSYDACTARFV